MDGEDEPDSLARFRQGLTDQPTKESWLARLGHALDRWAGLSRLPVREKVFLAVAGTLIVGVLIVSIYLLTSNSFDDGGGKQLAAARSQATPAATRPLPPTPTATSVPTPATPLPADRQDCNAIRGTEYNSDTERQFFNQNCQTPTGGSTNPEPGQGSQPTESPPQPAPSSGFAAGDAISEAVYWITHNAPQAYSADAGSCNAVPAGSHWVVTCNASLAGCQGSVCAIAVSVCVFSDPLQVRPSDRC